MKTLSSALAIVLVGLSSCREPTSVFVDVYTNVPYRDGLATTFTAGAPGATESAEPTTETRAPFGPGGSVGSLAIVPRTADDALLAVKVVLGVKRDARECRAPDYAGCIVARRTIRFRPRTEQVLPIHLFARCENVPCSAGTTCDESGECVPADAESLSSSPASPDGGTTPGDAATGADASASDASVQTDATVPTPVGGSVDCPGPDGPCIGSRGCCWKGPSDPGDCLTSCGGNQNAFMACDGPEDCAPGDAVCCLSLSNEQASCRDACSGTEVEVCHSTGVCGGGGTCSGIFRGHFRTCQ